MDHPGFPHMASLLREYQWLGAWEGAAAPQVPNTTNGAWGYELWSEGGATTRHAGERVAAVWRGYAPHQQETYGDWSARSGVWLYRYRLAGVTDGWPAAG